MLKLNRFSTSVNTIAVMPKKCFWRFHKI